MLLSPPQRPSRAFVQALLLAVALALAWLALLASGSTAPVRAAEPGVDGPAAARVVQPKG